MPKTPPAPLTPEQLASTLAQLLAQADDSAKLLQGIGTDLCDSRRIAAAYAKHGQRLVQRILTEAEQGVFAQRQSQRPERGLRYLASRFAAKEALGKALGTGIRGDYGWQSCSVLNNALGQPEVQPHGALAEQFTHFGLRAHISLSDEGDWIAAFCVLSRT